MNPAIHLAIIISAIALTGLAAIAIIVQRLHMRSNAFPPGERVGLHLKPKAKDVFRIDMIVNNTYRAWHLARP